MGGWQNRRGISIPAEPSSNDDESDGIWSIVVVVVVVVVAKNEKQKVHS